MASKGVGPGNPQSEPIESRRATAAPGVDSLVPAGEGGTAPEEALVDEGEEGTGLDVPDMGTFSAESARPTPLDDIAETERSRMADD